MCVTVVFLPSRCPFTDNNDSEPSAGRKSSRPTGARKATVRAGPNTTMLQYRKPQNGQDFTIILLWPRCWVLHMHYVRLTLQFSYLAGKLLR